MGYHDAREIPNYWTYAQNFVLQDDMFEPLPRGTGPSTLEPGHATRIALSLSHANLSAVHHALDMHHKVNASIGFAFALCRAGRPLSRESNKRPAEPPSVACPQTGVAVVLARLAAYMARSASTSTCSALRLC